MTENLLPPQFAELEPYARIWSLATEAERWTQRRNAAMPALTEFYNAFFPRLDEAIGYCDKFPLDDLPEEALALLRLIYSLVLVAMAVEIFQQPMPTDSADAELDRVKEPVP